MRGTRLIGGLDAGSIRNLTFTYVGGQITYSQLPTGNGSWDTGSGTTITITRGLTVSSAFQASSTAQFNGEVTVTGASITIDNARYYKAKRNTSSTVINVLGFDSGTDDLYIRSGGSTTGSKTVLQDTGNNNLLTILNGTGAATHLGSIKTADPGSGAGAWKLGQHHAAVGLVLVTTDYIELDVDGTVYKLAEVT